MAICKMNVVDRNGRSAPECTNCGHRFDTDYAKNPYAEMCRIAKGKFAYCPVCGAKYVGCQIAVSYTHLKSKVDLDFALVRQFGENRLPATSEEFWAKVMKEGDI